MFVKMDDESDIPADECLLSGIDPDICDVISKITDKHELVYQVLLDTDCLNWSDLYHGDGKMDVCSFIAAFNEKMLTETNESIFSEQNVEIIKTLPFLFIEAKKRFENLSSVNTESGNSNVREFIPFQRENPQIKKIIKEESLTITPCNETKWFTANRETVNLGNAVNDFRYRRLSPGTGLVQGNENTNETTDSESATVAELWAINAQLRPVSKLIQVLEGDNATRHRVAWLTFESIRSRLTTINSIRRQMKHISDLIKFTVTHFGDIEKLQGQLSAVIIRDFLIQIKVRGHTVPLAARSAITTWADTLQLDWRSNDNLVKSAIGDSVGRKVAQAPPFTLEFLILLERITENEEAEIGLKLFASAILLTVHASLRFSDIQRISTFTETDEVIHGTLTACKVRKQHGLPWPFASLRKGFTNKGTWHRPIMDFRNAYYSGQHVLPTFTIPTINDEWVIENFIPATYNLARRRLLMLAILMKEKNPERFTLHSGKNFYPTCGAQMRMEREKRNKLGHWTTLSSMAERYDRSTCSTELQLRSDILTAIAEGWAPVDSFQIPNPIPSKTAKVQQVELERVNLEEVPTNQTMQAEQPSESVITGNGKGGDVIKRLTLVPKTTTVVVNREGRGQAPVGGIHRRIQLVQTKRKVGRPKKK